MNKIDNLTIARAFFQIAELLRTEIVEADSRIDEARKTAFAYWQALDVKCSWCNESLTDSDIGFMTDIHPECLFHSICGGFAHVEILGTTKREAARAALNAHTESCRKTRPL